MSTSVAFQKAYRLLNPDQKRAVDEIEGPVMVIAGPGTGKTQVLTTRIANILQKTDTNPRNILALTYTESAATNMRDRLVKMIGKEGHYVQIATFHAFCSEVISEHGEYFAVSSDARPLSDLERFEFFSQIIEKLELQILKPINDPFHHLKSIAGRIYELKRENISIKQLQELTQNEAERLEEKMGVVAHRELEKKIKRNQDLALIYAEYQKTLVEKKRYDFEDMIGFVVAAFQNHKDLLLEYQENLLYFLVDEYQDTNSAQNQVIDLLASYWSDKPNLFVVGDPNQSIYRFQGASVENALAFIDKYPLAQVITLTTGYRCPQPIYDLAHQLIKQNNLTKAAEITPNLNPTRLKVLAELNKKLRGPDTNQFVVDLTVAPSRTAEIIKIAETIKGLVTTGVNLSEIAILFHDNIDAELIKEILYRWNLTFAVQSSSDVLKCEEIRQLLALFRLINDLNQDDRQLDVFTVLAYRWLKIDKLKLMKLAKIANLHRLSLLECLDQGYLQVATDCEKYFLNETDFTELTNILDLLRTFKSEDANLTFTSWFELVINQSGFLNYIKTLPNHLEIIVYLKSLFDQIKNLNQVNHELKLDGFLKALALMEAYHLTIKSENIKLTGDAIHLSTVHKAKGQEWNQVFVVGLEDKKWGNQRERNQIELPAGVIKNTNLEKKDRDEDDRRLFYVALTRARHHLYLSTAKSYVSGNQEKSRLQSIFLSEIENPQLINSQPPLEIADELLAKLVETPSAPVTHQAAVTEFFTEVVKNYQLTVSDLKIYLRNPKEFVEKVLLRLPSAKAPFFAYGTAVHGALEFLYSRQMQLGKFPEFAELADSYRFHLEKEILTTTEFSRRLKLGLETLKTYYEANRNRPFTIFGLEKKLGGFNSPIVIADNICLAGRIDRLDWTNQNTRQIKVIDYKTGKQKSVNEIEGKVGLKDYSAREMTLPESIRGHYKRQLLFYKLLIENDRSLNMKVTHGVFEFVEPKENGKLVNRVFELDDQDVEALKTLIVEVMTEIRQLKFLEFI